jgi:RNA polymerase sigma-70 factor, ECF subfamily
METIEQYRSCLHLWAEARIDRRLRSKLDPSDIVQQTLVHAWQAWNQFRGTTEEERAAWLRQILARTVLHNVRDFHRDKRDVAREQSLDAIAEQSSARLEAWLVAEQSSPSQKVVRWEETRRAAEAIRQLPDAQRDAVILYYWQGCSTAEIAEHLGRSPAAVAGLLHRGLAQLRGHLQAIG